MKITHTLWLSITLIDFYQLYLDVQFHQNPNLRTLGNQDSVFVQGHFNLRLGIGERLGFEPPTLGVHRQLPYLL